VKTEELIARLKADNIGLELSASKFPIYYVPNEYYYNNRYYNPNYKQPKQPKY
jgi:hypothetical protein